MRKPAPEPVPEPAPLRGTITLRHLAAACAFAMIAACTSKPVIHYTREASTGIAAGESIAVVLRSRIGPDGNAGAAESDQQTIAKCVERGLHEVSPRLALAPKADAPGVRYVVNVEARTSHSSGNWETAGSGGGLAVGKSWTQTSEFSAEVIDVKHGRLAGNVSTSATGQEGGGVMLILILPVPFGYWSSSESKACEALGKGVAQLIGY
jgi:hypothetical protein